MAQPSVLCLNRIGKTSGMCFSIFGVQGHMCHHFASIHCRGAPLLVGVKK